MRNLWAKLLSRKQPEKVVIPTPSARIYPAPEQLEEIRELSNEERDQLAAFLKSPAGAILIKRARAIEFRSYRQNQPAGWGECLDWMISLSRVPRDNGNEFHTDMDAGHGDLPIHERVSP